MPLIVLMDDTRTASGHMTSGCEFKLEGQGFECVFEDGIDRATGRPLQSANALGKRLNDVARNAPADGIVLDIVWGKTATWNGFDIWNEARGYGLAIDNRMVVFVTQHLARNEREELAEKHGFDKRQVQFKNAQGIDEIVRWFCEKCGLPFKRSE